MDVKTSIALSLALVSGSLHAAESPITSDMLHAPMARDLEQVFSARTGNDDIIALSSQEMKDTQGAWWFAPAFIGGAFNSAAYVWSTPNWTWRGVGRAFGSGATAGLWGVTPIHWIARAGLGAFGAASWYRF